MLYARATEFRAGLAALALCAALAGCSDHYLDRRDTLSLSAGDALAVNKMTHMVDPWPRASGNRDIAFDGQRMQAAAERYRNGRVTPPVNAMTSSAAYQAGPLQPAPGAGVGSGP